ncbi:MAG: N-acetylmuramoyl-L-alanine amidase [Clostridiales bacterium]
MSSDIKEVENLNQSIKKRKTSKRTRKKVNKKKKSLILTIITLAILASVIAFYKFGIDKEVEVKSLKIKITQNWNNDSQKGIINLYKSPKKSNKELITKVNLKDHGGSLLYDVIAQKNNFEMIKIKSTNYGEAWIFLSSDEGAKNGEGYEFVWLAEFENVEWMGLPASYKEGRNYKIIWNVIHCTEGNEDNQAAENGATYDKTRTDGASVHFYHDPDSSVQTLYTKDRAFGALYVANERGVHHELCGLASQTQEQWLDKNSKNIIDNAAKISAYVCKKYDIPAKWLNEEEINDRKKGFLTHADISKVLSGNHTDPGAGFPKEYFIERVKHWIENV